MPRVRNLVLALMLVPLAAATAAAQFAPPPPPGSASSGIVVGAPPGGGVAPVLGQPGPAMGAPQSSGPSPAQAACMNEFGALRQDAEKRGLAIKAAADRKAPPREVCGAFRTFATAEEKVVKFFEVNQARCGIPAEAVKQMKANHGRSIKIRDQVCNAARAGTGAPPPPSLSDALGTSRLPERASSGGPSGRGTFDTLTGSPQVR